MVGERTASRLTPARIERRRYDPGRGGTQRLWDVVSPGLGVQVFASGRKSWLVRLRDGRFRTLGAVSAFGLDAARQRAAVTRETGEPPAGSTRA